MMYYAIKSLTVQRCVESLSSLAFGVEIVGVCHQSGRSVIGVCNRSLLEDILTPTITCILIKSIEFPILGKCSFKLPATRLLPYI